MVYMMYKAKMTIEEITKTLKFLDLLFINAKNITSNIMNYR